MTGLKHSGCSDAFDKGEGCINGDWYGFCANEDCYGGCEYQGPCGCTGCENEDCCAKKNKVNYE